MSEMTSMTVKKQTMKSIQRVQSFRQYWDTKKRTRDSIINEIFTEEIKRIEQKIKKKLI